MLSDKIKKRLEERFKAPLPEFYKRRIIFWLDADQEFIQQVDELELPGVNLIKLTGNNNFAVKKLLSFDDLTNNYLIYDPLTYEKDQRDDWLLDIKLYSEEFRADLVSIQMEELNVEQTPAMRKTMKIYAKFLDNKERKAKLKKIGKSYNTPLELHIDIISVLCGLSSGSVQDIIMAILVADLVSENNEIIANIQKFGSIEAFWKLIQKYTGYNNVEHRSLSDMAAHILINALAQTMPEPSLKGLERFIVDANKAYCYQLIHEWQKSDYNEDLFDICRQIEEELRLSDRFSKIEISTLLKSDIFPAINETILKYYYAEIAEHVIKVDSIIETVENRRVSGWYDLTVDYFESLYYIAKMQEFYISHIQGFHMIEPAKIWELYTRECYMMDSHYRHYHFYFGNTLKSSNSVLEDPLKKCTDVVEGIYREWYLKELTANWTDSISEDLESLGYVSEISRMKDFYRKYVLPNINKGNRVFVVISDALRYEVAAELTETLCHTTKGKATLDSIQAIFPSITKFGMASLLPGSELTVNNKMEVLVDNYSTASTASRETILKSANPNSVAVTFRDLLQMKQTERRSLVQGMEVIYVYHNTIDALGDKIATETKVFEACDTAISELNAIVKTIVNDLSGKNLLITADHGFIYTYKPLEESQKISKQTFNGEIYELGRRYSLVAKATSANYLLEVKTEREIGGIPMKAYTPQDTIRIKVQGGGENYIHGGVSLQEMVVPVIIYKGMRSGQKKYVEVKNPGMLLISESRKISNLIFSLEFLQKEPIGEKIQPCSYNLNFIDEAGLAVSDTQIIIADKSNTNATERVFRVKFTLKQMQFSKNRQYKLVISNSTDVPVETEFIIDIAFADDFGFDL